MQVATTTDGAPDRLERCHSDSSAGDSDIEGGSGADKLPIRLFTDGVSDPNAGGALASGQASAKGKLEKASNQASTPGLDDTRISIGDGPLSLYFLPGTTPPWVSPMGTGRSCNPPSPLCLDGKKYVSSGERSYPSSSLDGVSHISPRDRSSNGGEAHATSNVSATAETRAEPTKSSF